jgi:hypothetical protein
MWTSWSKEERMEIRKMTLDDWTSLLEISAMAQGKEPVQLEVGEMAWKVQS